MAQPLGSGRVRMSCPRLFTHRLADLEPGEEVQLFSDPCFALGVGCYTLGFFLGSGFICCNLFLLVRCCTEPICDSNIPAEVMVPHSPRSVTSRCSLTTVSPRSVRHGSFPWRNSLMFFYILTLIVMDLSYISFYMYIVYI